MIFLSHFFYRNTRCGSMALRVLLILPHPDDGEELCPCTIYQLVQAGHDVTMALATCDQYGTDRNDFKGRRIEWIRRAEMRRAARIYGLRPDGTSLLRLAWLGFIDGHVPLSRFGLQRVHKLLADVRPQLVISTDPAFPIDEHPDHLNIGRLALWAVRRLPPDERPRLWLCQSYNHNLEVPFSRAVARVAWQGFHAHVSQLSPLLHKLNNQGRAILYYGFRRLQSPWPAEYFREVLWQEGEHRLKSFGNFVLNTFYHKVKFGMYKEGIFAVTPEELGLVTAPQIVYERPLNL
jgi:LmbE family N-acetylglucosaminyl deacetylase